MNYAFFLMLRASTAWLRLSREQRAAIAEPVLSALHQKHPRVRSRHFDAEAFSADCSDIALLETDDPREYYFYIEGLRDSPLIAQGYFEVVRIVPAIEDGYRAYEAAGN